MGEGRTSGDKSPTNRRLTVSQAATELGITEGAVRGRVKRRTLRSEREGGTVYVILEGVSSSSSRDETTDPHRDQSELVAVLREQLAAERQAHAEARRIIMQQAVTMRQLTAASPQEAPEDAETVEEAPEGSEPRSATVEAQEDLDAERTRREMAETTMHEGMTEERRRREEAERERDELRRELVGLGRRTEVHEAAEGQQGRGEPRSGTGEAQEGARRPWWRRVFGR